MSVQVLKPAEFEQGIFWYFDWHLRGQEPTPGATALGLPDLDGWCWRSTKQDFKFEYKHVRQRLSCNSLLSLLPYCLMPAPHLVTSVIYLMYPFNMSIIGVESRGRACAGIPPAGIFCDSWKASGLRSCGNAVTPRWHTARLMLLLVDASLLGQPEPMSRHRL